MATTVVDRGKLRIGQQASESTNYNAARNIQTLSVDDNSTGFSSTHTNLLSAGSISNEFDQALSTPTESSQTIIHTTTIGTGDAIFTIRRIALHDDTAANVNTTSTTLVMGIDGQALVHTADFTLTITCRLTYANNGAADTLVVNRGLLRIGAQASESTPTYSDSRNIQVMSIDDSTVSFAATDTALNTGGAVANEFDAVLDSTPTESGTATITHLMTVPTGSGNFTVRRIALHDNAAGSVDATTATLVAGIDDESLLKTSDVQAVYTLTMTYS